MNTDQKLPDSISLLTAQVRAYCLAHHLLTPGPLVVAVSGGADSIALLHVLLSLRDEFGIRPHVATFDHGIRGPASAEDVAFVHDLAKRWSVPVSAGQADVPALAASQGIGLEAAARQARYSFLIEVAASIGAGQIALGHNQDDQAETVLLHVLRGAGLAGLRGMLPATPVSALGWAAGSNQDVVLIRPLLDTPRTAIDQYVQALGIAPRQDATNADPTYTRNRLRHEIMPLLATLNPQVRQALARTGQLARDDYDALQRSLPTMQPALLKGGTGLSMSRDQFLALPVGSQRHVLRSAAQSLFPALELSFERCQAAIDLLHDHASGASVALAPAADLWLRVANDRIYLFRESGYPAGCPWLPTEVEIPVPLADESRILIPDSDWALHIMHLDSIKAGMTKNEDAGILSDPLTAVLDIPAGAANTVISLRTRRTGDRFQPQGSAGHSQKLSDTLINMKVQAVWRGRVPLLTIDGMIAWLVAPCPADSGWLACSRVAHPFAAYDDLASGSSNRWCFQFKPV